MKTQGDIHVFVLTYNRCVLLGETIESILQQTRLPDHITVVDNGSTDGTVELLEKYRPKGVEIIRYKNNSRDVWQSLPSIAAGRWVLLFHDDDLLHPRFIEHALEATRVIPDATVVVSGMIAHQELKSVKWLRIDTPRIRRRSAHELARLLYGGYHMPFSSVLYRVDALLKQPLWDDRFGKIYDRPLVLSVAKEGFVAHLLGAYTKYRVHQSQDSADSSTGPFLHQRLALHRFYLDMLGDSPSTPGGRTFLRRNFRNLCGDFALCRLPTKLSFSQFIEHALLAGATTRRAIVLGRLYMLLTQIPRAFERCVRGVVRRRITRPQKS